jgi:hypothetical protein
MDKKVLLRVQNKLIKGIALRRLIESGCDVVEVTDREDLRLKLAVYNSGFFMYIMEVTEENLPTIFDETSGLRKGGPLSGIPVLAMVPRDTSDIISQALKSGIEDVLLLPKAGESFRQQLYDKLGASIDRFKPSDPPQTREEAPLEEMGIESIRSRLELELRHAKRGKYPVSMLMIRFTDVDVEKAERFIERLKGILRETDNVYRLKDNTWLVSCPFTEKKYIIEVERKVFSTFEAEMGQERRHKKINLFTAAYPEDEESLDRIFERLETGISNSMAISNIKAPLNSLTRSELEEYKKKIKQFKKFF